MKKEDTVNKQFLPALFTNYCTLKWKNIYIYLKKALESENSLLCIICLPGAGTMIGVKSGKVMGYSARNKRCAICEAASRTGQAKVRCHDCRLNCSGSSKAMEPDMGKKDNPQSMLLTFISCISILLIKVAFLLTNLVIIKCAMY